MQVEWVADADALNECLDRWRRADRVGFDTEFIRVRTFYPQIALYQVGVGHHCALIDPLAIQMLDAFRDWLSNPATVLVMHSCSEDLEVLQHHLGVLPATLYDTQIAASFVGREHGLGYQTLVRRELGIELQKGETRSDWLRRPLSDEQQRYAAEDVHYLPPLFECLQERLIKLGRQDWAWQEMRRLRDAAAPRRPEDYYRGARDAWRLDARQLAVFRALCLWREETARRRDRPRGHVVGDEALLDIARRGLSRRRELAPLLPAVVADRDGEELQSRIELALNLAPTQLPASLPGPLSAAQGELLKLLRVRVGTLAQQLDMAETTLASRRYLEAFVRGLDSPSINAADAPESSRWRDEVVTPELNAVVRQWRTVAQR